MKQTDTTPTLKMDKLRAGETLPKQRPGQNDRPQTTKGAKP